MRHKHVVAVLAFVLLAPAGCADDEDRGAFSVATDDLCEWVSEDDVAGFVAAELDWDGTATEVDPGLVEVECEWELTGADGWIATLTAGDAARWEDFDGNRIDLDASMAADGVLDHDGATIGIGRFVAGHPSLSEGVVVFNGGFGQFAFAVPPDTEWLALTMGPPGGEGEMTWEEFEPRFFAIVDHLLDELGWLA